jgi:FeS assembly SUF system protein
METRPKSMPLNLSKLGPCPGDSAVTTPVPETPLSAEEIKDRVTALLKTVYDPEIPVNIYELGLVYGLDVSDDKFVNVRMTLTSPACPVAGSLVVEVESKIKGIPGVAGVKVDLVWDPPWDQNRMSDAAKLQLGLF